MNREENDNSFEECMSWMSSEFNMKENTLYDDYDDRDYSQTDYEEEERYLSSNRE